jgi:DNA-binding MarR family transcriptional regulator
MPDAVPRDASRPAATIRDLLSYRIHRLAGALSRGAALRYRAGFGVTLMEWRALALLGDFAPMTLQALALQAGLDKSQVSRVVSGLVARGLVRRDPGRADAREVALSLTAAGRRVQQGLMAAARARDAAFAAALTEEERRVLDRAIAKLTAEAKRQADPAAWD